MTGKSDLKSLNKEILALAIPNIISNISVPLIASVDTGLMGRLSPAHVAAVGISSMMFNMLYWNFGFLRMGTTGITAQAHGALDHEKIGNTLVRAMLLGLFIGLVFLLFRGVIYNAGSFLLNVSDAQQDMVWNYFNIRILDAPATLMLISLMGWFFGRQNAIYPLIITIVLNVTNILTSIYFVRVLNWEISGVAWGSVIAQYVGLILAIVLLMLKYRKAVRAIVFKKAVVLQEYLQFLSINADIFIRTVSLTFVFGFFYRQSSGAGEMVLAANVILMQFVNWMSYGIDGFAYAAESVVGKYRGSRNEERTYRAIKLSFLWGGAVALLYSLVYWILGEQILGLFTTDEDLFEFTKPLLIWVVITPIFGFASYIWDGIYVGLVASKGMRNAMLAALVFFLLVYYFIPELPHSQELWIALIVFLVMRAVIQHILFWKKGWELE